jgi:hypothetical protein
LQEPGRRPEPRVERFVHVMTLEHGLGDQRRMPDFLSEFRGPCFVLRWIRSWFGRVGGKFTEVLLANRASALPWDVSQRWAPHFMRPFVLIVEAELSTPACLTSTVASQWAC